MEENAGDTNSNLCIARSSLHDSGTLVGLTFQLIELDLLTLAPPTNPLLDLRVRIGFVVLGGFDYEAVAISRRPQLKGPRSHSPNFGLHLDSSLRTLPWYTHFPGHCIPWGHSGPTVS